MAGEIGSDREPLVQRHIRGLAARRRVVNLILLLLLLLARRRRVHQFLTAAERRVHIERFARSVDIVLLLLLMVLTEERRRVLCLDDSVFGFVDGFSALDNRRREVECVDDAVLFEALVHLVHLLANRVNNVLLVLASSLFV